MTSNGSEKTAMPNEALARWVVDTFSMELTLLWARYARIVPQSVRDEVAAL